MSTLFVECHYFSKQDSCSCNLVFVKRNSIKPRHTDWSTLIWVHLIVGISHSLLFVQCSCLRRRIWGDFWAILAVHTGLRRLLDTWLSSWNFVSHIGTSCNSRPGRRKRNRVSKKKQHRIVFQRNTISLEFCAWSLVLRQYQYSFMQWRRVRRGKTISIIFSVCQSNNNCVVGEGLIDASTKTRPEHERCATGLSTTFSHIVNVHWALNLKSYTL